MTGEVQLRLRPTMLSDLEFVLGVERDAANLPHITPWERTQHEGAMRIPDFRHFIVEAGPAFDATGFGPNCDSTRLPKFDIHNPVARKKKDK